MGSKKPLQLQPQLQFLRQDQDQEIEPTKPAVSLLLNSSLYFFHHVLIIKTEEVYRLMVIHNNRVLFDKNYETSKGARVGFAKYFKESAFYLLEENLWSHFYSPEKKWLDDRLKGISFSR